MDKSPITDLSQYTDCIFVINIDRSSSSSQILGTFFSKEKFEVNTGNIPITGQDIIYLPTTQDEQSYKYDNDTIDIPVTRENNHVYFVKTDKNIPTASANEIYSVEIFTSVKIDEDKKNISGVTNIQVTDRFELPTSIEGNVIQQKSDEEINTHANEIITNIQAILNELTTMLKGGMQRGGTDEDKEDNFKKVIYKFKDFVNRFITDSIIFQINSLNATEIKTLFNTDTINIDEETYQRNDIKKPLFDNIYSNVYVFNVNYQKYMIEDSSKLADYDHTTHHKATYYYILKPLENDVIHDTQIYHDITSLGSTDKIHIYQFANQFIKFYNEHYRALKSESYFNGIIDNIYIIISDIIERFKIDIVSDKTKKIINIKSIIKSFHEPNNQVFRKDLGIQLQNNAVDKIITYVKINNFEKDQYNKRFDILIKGTQGANIGKFQNAMSVSYNDHNFPYYIKNEKNELVLNKGIVKDNISITQKELTVNKYKNTYLFGNYTQIFEPNKSNNKIADEMDVITKQVELGKPVFMLGYGASGSGKTSSLIYYNKGKGQEKNGILIHLCNILGKDGYTNIEMTAKEYFTVNGDRPDDYCNGNNRIDDPIHCDTTKFEFNYENNNFILKTATDNTSKHKYRVKVDNTQFETNANMGDVMIYLIDQDRFVKATTNNPQSSRSHSMIYLKLTHTTKPPGYIIVGDYAGVENKFTCENASTIIDFLEKKRDCGNEDNTNCKPYYSEEIISTEGEPHIFDSFNGKENGILVEKDEAVIYSNEKTVKDLVFDFVSNNTDKDGFNDLLYNVCNYDQTNYSKYRGTKNVKNEISDILYEYLRHDTSDLTNITKNITEIQKKIDGIIMKGGDGSYINEIQNILNHSFSSKNDIEEIMTNQFLKVHGITVSKNYDVIDIKYHYEKDKVFEENFTQKYNAYVLNKYNAIVLNKYKGKTLKSPHGTFDVVVKDTFYTILNQYHMLNKGRTDVIMLSSQGTKDIYKPLLDESMETLVDFFRKIITNEKKILMIKQEERNITVNGKNKNIEVIVYGKKTELDEKTRKAFSQIIYDSLNISTKDDLRGKVIKHYKDINTKPSIFKDITLDNTLTYEVIDDTKINNQYKSFLKGENFIEQIKQSYFKELYVNIENIKQEEIHEKNVETNRSLNANMQIIKEFISVIEKRFRYGIQICNRRVVEGEFINESLREIRENIKDIITVKSQDKVFNSPDYIDICLEQYCPTHADCFKTNPITDMTKLEIKSVLIKSIYEYIKGDKQDYSIEKFYKEILISIFCVFNISRQANNPPPVPYIDINDLKIDVATYKPEEEKEQNIIEHLKRLYYKLNNGKNFSNERLDYADETTFEQHQVSVILSSNPYNEIYNKTDEMFEEFDIETIKEFIETIDNNNAVSAIGTLEFVDQIAKYNTTKTICSSNKIVDANVARYKDAYRYKNLYE
jgi:acid stress-induced BolA-like protein IbaG/YrbA